MTANASTFRTRKSTVLLVDDDPYVRSALHAMLNAMGYDCVVAANGAEARVKLADYACDVAIVDIVMPEMDGNSLLKHLHRERPDMAVIMLTGLTEQRPVIEVMRNGAIDCLLKPVSHVDLRASLGRANEYRETLVQEAEQRRALEEIVARRHQELAAVYRETIHALGAALDTRDPETQEHAQRVVGYSVHIARKLGITGRELINIERGAALHDIGKIGVSDTILFKPGPLTDEEWSQMRKHPEIGHRMLKRIEFLDGALPVVLSHHEHYNGGGYPYGMRGDEIPVGARIFTLADTIDALTSDRPYRKGRSLQEAKEEIARCAGTQFDPDIVDVIVHDYELTWEVPSVDVPMVRHAEA